MNRQFYVDMLKRSMLGVCCVQRGIADIWIRPTTIHRVTSCYAQVFGEVQCGNAASLQSRPGPAQFLSFPLDETMPERTPLSDDGECKLLRHSARSCRELQISRGHTMHGRSTDNGVLTKNVVILWNFN